MFDLTHSMLICFLHTQTQLHQADLTSMVMFRTVHHCIVNDKFGYKYCKQSTNHLHFGPIPHHTLDRTICPLHRLQLYFFRFFLLFFRFDEQGTFLSFSSSERVVTLMPGVTLWSRLF